jgi:hypothetical protein
MGAMGMQARWTKRRRSARRWFLVARAMPALLFLVLAGVAAVPAVAAGGTSLVLVPPSASAASKARIAGATPAERVVARVALALVGNTAARMRLSFTGSKPSGRSLAITTTPSGQHAATMSATFLGRLVAVEISTRLRRTGENVVWTVLPAQTQGATVQSVGSTLIQLERAADVIAARARVAGWSLAPTRLFRGGGGGLIVTVRLGERALLENRNTAFASTLLGSGSGRPPIATNALLLVEGPGGAFVGGGSAATGWSYGGSNAPGTATAPPASLAHASINLHLTIDRARPPATRVNIRCGAGAPRSDHRVCAELLRERAVLFSPVLSDTTCGGGGVAGGTMTLEGTIAGVHIERNYSNCYSDVTSAWEHLLRLGP